MCHPASLPCWNDIRRDDATPTRRNSIFGPDPVYWVQEVRETTLGPTNGPSEPFELCKSGGFTDISLSPKILNFSDVRSDNSTPTMNFFDPLFSTVIWVPKGQQLTLGLV